MASYPQGVNGLFYELADVSMVLNGAAIQLAIKNISYKNAKKRGNIWGAHPEKLGTTRGKVEPEASFEMYKAEADAFTSAVILNPSGAGGVMETPFVLTIIYGNISLGQPLLVDALYRNGLEEEDETHAEGIEALTVKFNINVARIAKNGKTAL